ncbi:protein phosphatase 1 regulatory subunit 3G [Brachyhypopomus gauderio]|uniref:protein phosphatase 1 regulatory subunit 3G n=1 Tax=Brachyhypopomus gauderio TaxID=698409 RepID=UPI004042E2DC
MSESGLNQQAASDAQENGVDPKGSDLEPEDVYLRDRRRAKSLPAYPEQASLLNEISQNCRKRVKFADALGLNLASVKHFSANEDPEIPSKVLTRLQSFPPQPDRELFGELCVNFKPTRPLDRLVPTFAMPVDSADFEARVKRLHVALEKVTVTRFDVRGLVRVRPADSRKRDVGVRYTFNDWLSFVDAQAVPVSAEDVSDSERFSFTMYTPPFLEPSSSVHFAVYLKVDDGEFWDNNDGGNYTLRYHCLPPYETTAFLVT